MKMLLTDSCLAAELEFSQEVWEDLVLLVIMSQCLGCETFDASESSKSFHQPGGGLALPVSMTKAKAFRMSRQKAEVKERKKYSIILEGKYSICFPKSNWMWAGGFYLQSSFHQEV